MPTDDMLLIPREGHIDTEMGLLTATVALSMDVREDEDGGIVTMMHLDVATGGDIERAFSVGIPLRDVDVRTVTTAFATIRNLLSGGQSDRLN